MATDGASCEPDLSRAPDDSEGATAEAAVTEFPGRQERCRCGMGVVPGSLLDTPNGVPVLPGMPYSSPWCSLLPRVPFPSPGYPFPRTFPSFSGVPTSSCASSLGYTFLPRGMRFGYPFPGVSPRPEAGSSGVCHPHLRVIGARRELPSRILGDPLAHSRGAHRGSQPPLFTSPGHGANASLGVPDTSHRTSSRKPRGEANHPQADVCVCVWGVLFCVCVFVCFGDTQ